MGNLTMFNQDTALAILTLTRESLEERGEKGNYAHLNFYGNWCVHSELTQSPVCLNMLRIISDVMISDPRKDLSLPWFTDAINDALDLRKLRLQLIDFFEKIGVPADLFKNYDHWQHFCAYIREIVSLKPIKFPTDPGKRKGEAKRLHDEIEVIANQHNGLGAQGLWVSTEADKDGKWNCSWNIELFRPYITVQGPFTMNEGRF